MAMTEPGGEIRRNFEIAKKDQGEKDADAANKKAGLSPEQREEAKVA